MGLGILEPKTKGAHAPGTVFLDAAEASSNAGDALQSANLKKGTGKYADIILVPQPSSDPNDPLNWPLWQRDLILLLYCYCTLLCVGAVGPILGSITIPVMEAFPGTTFKGVSLLTGYQLVTVGASAVFVSALCCKFGKRPMMLFSMTCNLVGIVWGGVAKSYGSFLGARVVQGLGMAMFESVTYSIVADMYHVHQRGTRMSVYILAQSGMAQLPSVVSGKVAQELGWRWVFYLITIFTAIGWVCSVLFGWETQYRRREDLNLDSLSHENLSPLGKEGNNGSGSAEEIETKSTGSPLGASESAAQHVPRESLVQRMRPYHGIFTAQSLWVMIVRPFYVVLNPVVLWALMIIAFTSVWFIITNFTIAQAFAGPPYNLSVAAQGYMGAGPWVGGMLGCLASGFVCDPAARWLTKKNKGVYEPEFRLFLILLVPIFSSIGYFLFGNLIAKGQSPVAASVVYGFCFVPVQMVGVATGAFIVDAFRTANVEIFIISMAFKNFVFFGFTYVLNDWFASWGPAKMFNTIGAIELALCATTIPLYIYGKRLRAWWYLHDVLRDRTKA